MFEKAPIVASGGVGGGHVQGGFVGAGAGVGKDNFNFIIVKLLKYMASACP